MYDLSCTLFLNLIFFIPLSFFVLCHLGGHRYASLTPLRTGTPTSKDPDIICRSRPLVIFLSHFASSMYLSLSLTTLRCLVIVFLQRTSVIRLAPNARTLGGNLLSPKIGHLTIYNYINRRAPCKTNFTIVKFLSL